MRIDSGLMPGQVLQRTPRGAHATLRGACRAEGVVRATITARAKTVRGWKALAVGRARGGAFAARLRGIPTGGPYVVTLAVGRERVVVRGVLVGDVWLIAGQSNASGTGNLADRARPHRLVRALSMARDWRLAEDPLHHTPESPDRCHHEGRQETPAESRRHRARRIKGAGFGVCFGREMLARTGVPQGLIATAHGGTSMAQWDPQRRALGGESLYASMLASVAATGQPVAGVLWYQGESDANRGAADGYAERMRALVAATRADLRQPRLPWIMVQLGRHVAEGGGREWNAIQELQRRLPETIARLETVPTIDLALDDAIHIGGAAFATLAQRMASAADRLVHGADEPRPIAPVDAREVASHARGPTIEVRFANVVGGLRSRGRPLGFAVVDAEHRALPLIARAVLDGDRVRLELGTTDRRDLRVMYGHGRDPACSIEDARGFPLPVFGPLAIAEALPSAWLMDWAVGAVREGEDLARLPRPTLAASGALTARHWNPGPGFMVDLRPDVAGRGGHLALHGAVDVAEAMDLELRLGYDGPVRVWVDEREVHADPSGCRPAKADEHRARLHAAAGRHAVTVLLALDGGLAGMLYARFVRVDTRGATAEDRVAVPLPVPAAELATAAAAAS